MVSWITPDDIKNYVCDGAIDDATAQWVADATTGAVRDFINRDLEQGTFTELYTTNNTDYVMLEHYPIVSIASVQIIGYGVIQPFDIAQFGSQNTGWVRDDQNVVRKLRFAGLGKLPRCSVPNVLVTYTAGYPVGTPPDPQSSPWFAGTGLPTAIYEAMKLTAAAIVNAQASDPNVANEMTAGVFSATFLPTGIGAIPPAARSYLQPYVGYAP